MKIFDLATALKMSQWAKKYAPGIRLLVVEDPSDDSTIVGFSCRPETHDKAREEARRAVQEYKEKLFAELTSDEMDWSKV